MQPPFAAAAGASSLVTSLRFNPVPDEDLLPETRKDIADEMWDIILSHGIDCIFDDRLPPAEEFAYTESPLDSAPLLNISDTNADGSPKYTQADVDKAANKRKEMENNNLQKKTMRERLLKDYKAVLAVALLKAFKANAPLFERKCRNDHVLVAASGTTPAKHDGCAIFIAFRDATNHNDASRQANAAETEKKRLEIKLPDNATSSQFAKIVNKFLTDVHPYLAPKLTDQLVVEWVLARMPANLVDRRDAIKAVGAFSWPAAWLRCDWRQRRGANSTARQQQRRRRRGGGASSVVWPPPRPSR